MEFSQVSVFVRKFFDFGSGLFVLKNMKIFMEEDWLVFKKCYDEYFFGFMDYLKIKFFDFIFGEICFILLFKFDFSNKEIVGIFGIFL